MTGCSHHQELLRLFLLSRFFWHIGQSCDWRAVAALADIGQDSLVGRIPKRSIMS